MSVKQMQIFQKKRGKEKALTKLNGYVDIVDRCLLAGVSKVWIWANFVVQKLSWIFLIQDFPPSFVKTEREPIERRAQEMVRACKMW